MSYVQLGQACPSCTIASGPACIPCPDGSELPECADCVDGRPIVEAPSFWERSHVLAPILLGIVTTATTAWFMGQYMKGRE